MVKTEDVSAAHDCYFINSVSCGDDTFSHNPSLLLYGWRRSRGRDTKKKTQNGRQRWLRGQKTNDTALWKREYNLSVSPDHHLSVGQIVTFRPREPTCPVTLGASQIHCLCAFDGTQTSMTNGLKPSFLRHILFFFRKRFSRVPEFLWLSH